MTTGQDIFKELQKKARADGAKSGKPVPTAEYLTRHGLESFLARLTQTTHADDFILKGGILLAVYGVRRSTKDIDAEAVAASVTAEHIEQVVRDVAAVATDDDGIVFDLDSMTVQVIRDQAEYPGLRMRVKAHIDTQVVTIAWDISTGDPVVPAPQTVTVPRILGDPITMLGYAPETTVAENGVTILERGITSTRWRDYIDIVRLATKHGLDNDLLLKSARAVARYRQVELRPIADSVVGYAAVGQTKWQPGGAKKDSKTSVRTSSRTRWPKSSPSSTRSSRPAPRTEGPRTPAIPIATECINFLNHPARATTSRS